MLVAQSVSTFFKSALPQRSSFSLHPIDANTARQSLSLQFSVTMHIRGLIGAQGTATQLSDLECPLTLQAE